MELVMKKAIAAGTHNLVPLEFSAKGKKRYPQFWNRVPFWVKPRKKPKAEDERFRHGYIRIWWLGAKSAYLYDRSFFKVKKDPELVSKIRGYEAKVREETKKEKVEKFFGEKSGETQGDVK